MGQRVHLGGLVIAGLGFFLTRFTVTLALYEEPLRFLLSGVLPLTLGLGLAAFGVALAVADIEPGTVRTVAVWAVIGAVTMLVLALLTLAGSSGGEIPALDTVRSRAYLSNFLIGGSVGGTLTGLYAALNRQQRSELEQQANRLEVLNRLLRHEVLNSLTVIRGYASEATSNDSSAGKIVRQRVDEIVDTIDDVRDLAVNTRRSGEVHGSIGLVSVLEASIETVKNRYSSADIAVDSMDSDVTVRADRRVSLLFSELFEHLLGSGNAPKTPLEVTVATTAETARIEIRTAGSALSERERALLETGEITKYDDPSSGFGLNIVRLLAESYQGTIETSVNGDMTSVIVVLPRADEDLDRYRALPSGASSIRPALPHLLVILAAGMIAGVIWGIGSELFGGSVAFIGIFYGTASPLVGWITHQFHSGVFAFVYAGLLSVLPARYRDRLPAYVAVGVAWGLVLWIGAAGVIAPIWLRLLGIPASIPNLSFSLFVAHLTWGISLGVLTAWGYEHVVPRLAEVEWPSLPEMPGR